MQTISSKQMRTRHTASADDDAMIKWTDRSVRKQLANIAAIISPLVVVACQPVSVDYY